MGFRASAERTIGLLKLNSYLQFESFRSEPQSARPSRRTFSAATNAWILFRRRHGIVLSTSNYSRKWIQLGSPNRLRFLEQLHLHQCTPLRGGLEQMLGPQVLRVPSRSCKPAGRYPRTARNRLKMIGSRFRNSRACRWLSTDVYTYEPHRAISKKDSTLCCQCPGSAACRFGSTSFPSSLTDLNPKY